jgi:uncharacterized protein YdeI (YjbR/CyaY-like superfamily)
MKAGRQVRMQDRDHWRAWLTENHATATEVWLVFFKKRTGRAGLAYEDAIREALCFGWIDGILKRIDGEKHVIRFSPRRRNSIWSQRNKERVGRLIAEGLMTDAGMVKVTEAKANGQWDKATMREDVACVPIELTEALADNERARLNFERLAPCYRKQFIFWIGSAKRDETRRKRVAQSLNLLARNKRLGMEP